jgi:hypothetical protein
MKVCILGLGSDEDGDVGVSVFPECDEILIGRARLGRSQSFGGSSKNRYETRILDGSGRVGSLGRGVIHQGKQN